MPKKQAPTNAIVKWEEELARQAEIASGMLAGMSGGQFISLKSGRMSIDGAPVPDNKFNGVIIDYILENDWYSGSFDADTPVSPDCYAYARSSNELRPHEKASSPQGGPEHSCAGCPKNEFGTANVGKGKACQNRVRLAVIAENGLENIAAAEVRYLKVPPTSIRGYASYVRQLASVLHRPPFGVVTQIEEVPDDKTQFKVLFQVVRNVDDPEQLDQLTEKKRAVEAEIEFPYPEMTTALAPAARTAVKRRGQAIPVRKAAPARKAAPVTVPPSARVPAAAAPAARVRKY